MFAFMRRLQWKLTLSYMMVTLGVLLVVECLVLTVFLVDYQRLMSNERLPALIEQTVEDRIIALARPAFQMNDNEALDTALHDITRFTVEKSVYLRATLDIDGQLVALHPSGTELASVITQPNNYAENDDTLPDWSMWTQSAFMDTESGAISDVIEQTEHGFIMLFPVQQDDGQLVGILGIYQRHHDNQPDNILSVAGAILQAVGGTLIPLTIVVGIIGTLFGYLTARRLVHRFEKVSEVTTRWSKGDFSSFITDQSADELGAMAQRLNRMAEQIQNLLHTRRHLAVTEERNRLARELHDSVKQQVFAAGAQLRAGRNLLEAHDPSGIEHLSHADDLLERVRRELTTIVRQLRPIDLDERSLSQALQQMGERWSLHTTIALQLQLDDTRNLSASAEKALYRVVQEALSNIKKHSQASQAMIELSADASGIHLIIQDNGIGFDPQQRSGGFGLKSIRQRIQRLPGGEMTLRSESEEGTSIHIRIHTTAIEEDIPKDEHYNDSSSR